MVMILFSGIVCFHGGKSSVDDRDHHEFASFLGGSLHAGFIVINGGHHKRLSASINLSKLFGVGPADVSSDFKKYVPHLSEIMTNGTKLNPEGGLVRITLPAGTLSVVGLYSKKASYYLQNDLVLGPTCVARMTGIEVKLPPNFKAAIGDIDIPTDDDSWVLFENVTDESRHAHLTPGGARQHLKYHRPMTDAQTDDDIANVEELADDCTDNRFVAALKHLDFHPYTSLHPECSNTQWP